MIVPQHWSEARVQGRAQGHQVTVRRFGWSDASAADAGAMAQARAREAFDRIERGETLVRREPKVPYNGAEGVPIREEIVRRDGDTIVTRNSYGALCLNTPDVLFADIDFENGPSARAYVLLTLAASVIAASAGAWLGGSFIAFLAGLAALGLAPLLLNAAWKVRDLLGGGGETVARQRISRFVERHPAWLVDVYRTPKGLRALALHATFDPAGDEARAFFRAVGSDPLYVLMCARQRCFRARVSPKPWRIGIESHMKPRPGVWPVDPARLGARRLWIEEYERASRDFAACRFVERLGLGPEDPRAARVRELHDALARARDGIACA